MFASSITGHPGRVAMLATVFHIWWPKLHREVLTVARMCTESNEAGENIKSIQNQKQIGKLPQAKEVNDETAISSAGTYIIPQSNKKPNSIGRPSIKLARRKLLRKPTTDVNVIEFLKDYFAQTGYFNFGLKFG